MAAPPTVVAAGYYQALGAGFAGGEVTLRVMSAKRATLELGERLFKLTGNPGKKEFRGKSGSAKLTLRIVNRNLIKGDLDGEAIELVRSVLRRIRDAEMAQFDPGPEEAMKAVIDATPDYGLEVGDTTTFWYAFGPVLYRGRLDGTARVMCIASDPGPAECLPFARRTLIGDSGQKVQGFLAKLGLTRSYVLVNAFAVAMRPSQRAKALRALRTNVAIKSARHRFYDELLEGGRLQAIIAFGDVAHEAYDLWMESNTAVKDIPGFKLAHPAAVDREGSGNDATLKAWRRAIAKLREIVTPDRDGDPSGSNFGAYFTELDYVRIPRWDLPYMAPAYVGDDSWGRNATRRHNNCCARPSPDDMISLELTPPEGQGPFLRYRYEKGRLVGARGKNGRKVAVDAFGIAV